MPLGKNSEDNSGESLLRRLGGNVSTDGRKREKRRIPEENPVLGVLTDLQQDAIVNLTTLFIIQRSSQ